MESFIVLCQSMLNGEISEMQGYQFFSAVASRFKGDGNNDLFSHMQSGVRPITLSRLCRMPANRSDCTAFFTPGESSIRKGETFGFRVSFLQEGLSDTFFKHLGDDPLSLSSSMKFRPIGVLSPGEHPLCARSAPAEIKSSDYSSLRLRFLSSTGFNRSGLQISVPLPELVFKSLLNKWNELISKEDWIDSELDFSSVRMEKFALQSQPVWLKKQSVYRGCVGNCEYSFAHLEEVQRRVVSAMSTFSYFAGVGYKTSQGMGQVLPEIIK